MGQQLNFYSKFNFKYNKKRLSENKLIEKLYKVKMIRPETH